MSARRAAVRTTPSPAGRYPWSGDPHAGVKRFADYAGTVVERADVVVVGSGPGGAVVAHALAQAGKDVVLVEEGPPVGAAEFTTDAGTSMLRLLREGGLRSTRGNIFMPTMAAIALGGGSVVNSAICVRPPDWVFDKWAEDHGTHLLTGESLRGAFDRVQEFLGIEPTAEAVLGERNLSFKRGCDALGISSEPCPRNAPGCKGSAECFTGCRNGGKTSTDVSYVPAALRAGARVYTSLRVERVLSHKRRATGVTGSVVEPFTGRTAGTFRIDARAVVLAAGCMASPVILQRSGIGNENGRAGRHLRAHPGLAIMAVFPHKVLPWRGATQGYHSMHYLREGMKLEVLWSPPPIIATRFPGFGLEFKEQLAMFDRSAPFDVIADGNDSEGSVAARPLSTEPDIKFDIGRGDVEKLHRGACILSDIAFAAGADSVLPGLFGFDPIIRGPADVARLRKYKMKGQDAIIAGNHVFGTTRMGSDPATSVVDVDGRCHQTDNLYVADSGIIPMSVAVNPMMTIMALADRIGGILAARV
jgi:choline dehydrogenase-like flavoprotein